MTNSPQTSLFPSRESVKEVEAEAIASLPITSANQLIQFMRLSNNTLIEQIKRNLKAGE